MSCAIRTHFGSEQIRGMRVAADIYLDSLNLSEESEEVISQFSREVCKMSAFQLAHLLNAISQRRISHPFLPKHICTALNDCALPSTIYYICLIAYSLAKLSYLDKPLIHRIKEEFLLRAKTEFVSNQSLSFAVFAFACFRLSDRRLWRQIIELTEARKLNIQTLSQCVNSLAMVNADPKLVSSSVLEKAKTLNKDLLARHRLHFVHSLTILESLNAPLAERVLNKRFFGLVLNAHKKMGITEHLAQWDFICFRNIASAAQLELPKDKVPPINDALLDSGDPRSFSLVRDIKRGAFVEQKQSSLMERFELMFRLVAPLNSHSTSQEWHKTGAFLEGRCFVDTAEHQLIPLREANENSNVREVAVLLLMDRHFTQSIGPSAAEEEGPDRPTGINQMNIRHLKMRNFTTTTNGQKNRTSERGSRCSHPSVWRPSSEFDYHSFALSLSSRHRSHMSFAPSSVGSARSNRHCPRGCLCPPAGWLRK
uniref:Uncharacterized protein n=1 Tax=Globodera rostochiensis TaxID=31243 RepID=A0A914HWH2_GLORO